MASPSLGPYLPHAPWIAIAGELVTAACFSLLALFLPFGAWVTWPYMLLSWHFAAAIIGALALAWALIRRRPRALKVAIVLASYVGLPSLLLFSQALGEIRAAGNSHAMILTYAVWGLGAIGQAAVIFPCLRRLVPVQPLGTGQKEIQDAP
jgi:hypothetical protein